MLLYTGYIYILWYLECQAGNWGEQKKNSYEKTTCAFKCGHCLNNATCDNITGQCPDNQCEPGWKPPNCDHSKYMSRMYLL